MMGLLCNSETRVHNLKRMMLGFQRDQWMKLILIQNSFNFLYRSKGEQAENGQSRRYI